MQILLLLCRQGSLLLILEVYSVHNPMYTGTLYNFSCNGNSHKNYQGPGNRDVMHRPLCEDGDKILEGGTSTYCIFSISVHTVYYDVNGAFSPTLQQ